MSSIRPTNSLAQNFDIARADGVVTAQEAEAILSAVKSGGITDAEAALAEQVLNAARADLYGANKRLEAAQADYDLESADALMSAERLARMDPAAAIAELERTRRAMQEVTDALDSAKGTVAAATNQAEAAVHIRHQIEIARRVPEIVDNLSYGVFDWAIFDNEAKAALDQLSFAGPYAGVILRELASRDGGTFLRRLADQLPVDGKSKLLAVIESTDTETQRLVAQTLGNDLVQALLKAR